MNTNTPNPDDPYRDGHTGGTGGERQSGQPGRHPGASDGQEHRDPFEDSLAETWDEPDAATDRRLRAMVGPVAPLYAPPYGYERVVLRARRRRHRTAFIAAAASVVAVAVVAGGVVAGTHLGNGGSVAVAGCDSVGHSAPGAASGIDWQVNASDAANVADIADVRGGPSGMGAGREVMDRKYEWAIGGVLTATALSVGIVAGCSSSASNNNPSASATESGVPTPGPSSAGTVTLPSPSSSPSGATSGSAQATGVPRCHTADLSPAVNVVTGSQGAGHESINIKLTNTSGNTCTVYGYPGLKLEDANSAGQATTVTRDAGTKKMITVANGASVATTGRFDFDVPAADEPQSGNCEGPSSYLEITPPDETTQLVATIGGGPITVCEHGTIDVLPFIAGSTGPNQ